MIRESEEWHQMHEEGAKKFSKLIDELKGGVYIYIYTLLLLLLLLIIIIIIVILMLVLVMIKYREGG